MRSITESEAAAIRSLIAAQPVSERERIEASGLGSRTFERIRKRAFLSGWVFDRYLPNPVVIGRPHVSFVLAQPYAEHLEEVEGRWKQDIGAVLLWKWQETLLAVFFSEESATSAKQRAFGPNTFRRSFEVTADARRSQVIAYFDFEGAWSRFVGLPGVLAYPHPLPAEIWRERPPGPLSPLDRGRVAELVSRPFRRGAASGPMRVSPFFFPRSHQHLLASGLVERRVFLDLSKVPPYQGRTIERLVFVQGELLPGAAAVGLFRRLANIQVLPFLFVTDGSRVLLGALSPAPARPQDGRPPPAVLANLQRFLRTIEILREPLSSLNVVINHRYDRLVA